MVGVFAYVPPQEAGFTDQPFGIVSLGAGMTVAAPEALTSFALLDGPWHAYQPPAEVDCDAADAHFEVRQDMALGIGARDFWVVEDLRNGTVYKNTPWGFPDSDPLPTAIILGGPNIGNVPNVVAHGPWADGVIPIVRVDGDLSQMNTGYGRGLSVGGGKANRFIAAWSTNPWAGGGVLTFPIGTGVRVQCYVVGKNPGGVDKIQSPGMTDKVTIDGADSSYGCDDVLYKNFAIYSEWFGYSKSGGVWRPNSGTQVIGGAQGDINGRLRVYDCHIQAIPLAIDPESYWGAQIIAPPAGEPFQPGGTFGGAGIRHCMRSQAGGSYDFRRVTYGNAQEHCNYVDLINARADDPTGDFTWSAWIDCEMLGEISRTFLQNVDRPNEYYFQLNPTFPQLYKSRGIVLVDRCTLKENPGENASLVTMVGHFGTCIVRDTTHTAGKVAPFEGHRTLLTWEAGDLTGAQGVTGGPGANDYQGTRYTSDGFCNREFIVINVDIDVDNCEDGEHFAFQGTKYVRIYDFSITNTVDPKSAIGIDDGIQFRAGIQYTEDGVPAYNPVAGFGIPTGEGFPLAPGEGTPLSNNGIYKASCGTVELYFNYPAPWDHTGWGDGAAKIRWQFTAGSATKTSLDETAVNALAVAPAALPTGLSLSATTGAITGTPTVTTPLAAYSIEAEAVDDAELYLGSALITIFDGSGGELPLVTTLAQIAVPPAWTVLPVEAVISGIIINPGDPGGGTLPDDPPFDPDGPQGGGIIGHPSFPGGGGGDPGDPAVRVPAFPRSSVYQPGFRAAAAVEV